MLYYCDFSKNKNTVFARFKLKYPDNLCFKQQTELSINLFFEYFAESSGVGWFHFVTGFTYYFAPYFTADHWL